MKTQQPLPLLLKMLGVLAGDTCPMCGASGDNVVQDPVTGQSTCLLCMMEMAVLRMESMDGSPENIAEIRERIKRARAGEKLPPWDVKLAKPAGEEPEE